MESQRQKLVNILATKKLYSVIVIGTLDRNGNIFQTLDPPLKFHSDVKYTCSLLSLNAISLFLNIVESRNDTLYYNAAKSTAIESIKFNTGCYSVEDLDKHIQDV